MLARRLLKNFSWIITGNVFFGICQSLVVVLIAKFGNAEMLGRYSFALAITSPFVIFTRLNMRTFQATDASNEYLFGDYFYTRLYFTLISVVAIVTFPFFLKFSAENKTIIAGVVLYKSFESLSDIVYGRMQKEEWMSSIGKSQMLHGITLLLGIGLTLIILQNLTAGIFLAASAWLLIFFVYDIRIIRNAKITIEPSKIHVIKRLVTTCFPFGIIMMLVTVSTYIPSYFIMSMLGEKKLGYFSAIVYFMIFGGTIMTSLSQTVAPVLSKYYFNKNFIIYRRVVYNLLALSALVGIIGVVLAYFLGELILILLYSADYARYKIVFTLIMAATGLNFMGTFLGLSLTIARRFKEMVYMNIFAVVSLVVFCWLLIPLYKLTGAAWAVVAASFVKLVVNYCLNKKYLNKNDEQVICNQKNIATPSSSAL